MRSDWLSSDRANSVDNLDYITEQYIPINCGCEKGMIQEERTSPEGTAGPGDSDQQANRQEVALELAQKGCSL